VRLEQIPAASLTVLKATAALAPDRAQDTKAPGPGPRRPSRRRRGVKNDLGTLDVGRYLADHGIEYKTKTDAQGTMYVLARCLFDPSHGRGEAAIVQNEGEPLRYQCFHDSCKHRTWAHARRHISGEQSLAKWMTGYDPEKAKASTRFESAGSGFLADVDVSPPPAGERPGDARREASALPATVEPPKVPPPREVDPMEFFTLTKTGLRFMPSYMAKYLCMHFGHLAHTAGAFYRFEGGVWREVSEYVFHQACVQALKDRIQANHIGDTVRILRGLVNREPEAWPDPAGYINCLDGMVDLADGLRLKPHDPALGSRVQVPCHYGVHNLDKARRWFRCLEEVFPDEPGKADLLQEFFGYCLLTDCRFEKMLFLIGSGANGKGTVLHVLTHMVGSRNVASLTMKDLSDPKFSTYFLQDKLVNLATETSHRDPVATEYLKTIVSGEWITAERKHGNKFQFKPYAKMIFAMNDMPVIPDRSYGLERRLLILRFNRRFTERTKDPDLKETLEAEIDGVFAWALLGLERLLGRNRFEEGRAVEKDRAEFLKNLHPLLQFLEERCEEHPEAVTEIMDVYRSYTQWCEDGNYRKLARNRFVDQVLMTLPAVTKGKDAYTRRAVFYGLDLLP